MHPHRRRDTQHLSLFNCFFAYLPRELSLFPHDRSGMFCFAMRKIIFLLSIQQQQESQSLSIPSIFLSSAPRTSSLAATSFSTATRT
jgi:hypothetical protein